MARRPRVEFPGGLYHVISRGNRRQAVFSGDEDRDRFVRKLRDYKKRYGFRLYAYVLLDNHIHLLLETGSHPLSKIMQGILQSHSQYYNRRYGTAGHLFQGRYTAILCEKDAYLLQLVRYIHLNPVRAGLVRDPAGYRWSSHNSYLAAESGDLIDADLVLALFSQRRATAVAEYEEFVSAAIGEGRREDYYRVTDQRFLGSQEFVERLEREEGALEVEERSPRRTLDEIAQDVERLTGVRAEGLRGRGRSRVEREARLLFVRLSLEQSDAKRKEIARYLRRQATSVTYLSRQAQRDPRFNSEQLQTVD